MTPVDTPRAGAVLQIAGVEKNYLSLRPLRVQDLTIAAGERVALSGLDAGGAEVLVNLVTGASLPDRGEIRVLGRSTADITAGDDWLASLDRFGIMSPRAVLLDASTVEQNLAMPFTLDIDPVPPDIAATVAALARECGIGQELLHRVTGEVSPDVRARVHLARAIAHGPTLLILEHPTAALDGAARLELASDIVTVAEARQLATLLITQDDEVGRRIAQRVLRVEPATGAVKPVKRGWFR